MNEGKVKFFNEAKGFGFVTYTDANTNSEKEVFVHVSETTEELREGDQVSFELGEGKKGPMAVNVRRV